jgi:anaerobic selenocysteine-containing dehydrogenase
MHPDDAAVRDLCAGQPCEVRSATGSVHVELALSDALMPSAVALPHGHGHAAASGLTLDQRRPGVNVNCWPPTARRRWSNSPAWRASRRLQWT